jgi:hypothetical protein
MANLAPQSGLPSFANLEATTASNVLSAGVFLSSFFQSTSAGNSSTLLQCSHNHPPTPPLSLSQSLSEDEDSNTEVRDFIEEKLVYANLPPNLLSNI